MKIKTGIKAGGAYYGPAGPESMPKPTPAPGPGPGPE
jgi:hypothetical protein